MCRHGWMQAHAYHHSYGHCCCHSSGMRRVPPAKEELIRLEGYLKELQEEIKAVEERIKELKGRDEQGA